MALVSFTSKRTHERVIKLRPMLHINPAIAPESQAQTQLSGITIQWYAPSCSSILSWCTHQVFLSERNLNWVLFFSVDINFCSHCLCNERRKEKYAFRYVYIKTGNDILACADMCTTHRVQVPSSDVYVLVATEKRVWLVETVTNGVSTEGKIYQHECACVNNDLFWEGGASSDPCWHVSIPALSECKSAPPQVDTLMLLSVWRTIAPWICRFAGYSSYVPGACWHCAGLKRSTTCLMEAIKLKKETD